MKCGVCISLLLCGVLGASVASAQTTRVRGRVTDAATGVPLQFVSVVFPGTTTGITTDEEGVYALETRDSVAAVTATMVGYAAQTREVVRHTYNQLDFALEAVEFAIGDVVITPGDNPAHPILREVQRCKPRNNPDEFPLYRCSTYTKMELGLTNLKPQFRNRRLQRNFGFVFDYVDTSALTGQAYLPAMISETAADYYHSRRPDLSREVIRASRVSGVEDSFSIARFTGNLQNDINFYDNFIELFDVRFASPLAEGGLAYYDYFLVDSIEVEGRKTYKIRFHPKRLTTPVLDGEINIDSATYALQSASARMPKGVNVNWVKHLRIDNDNCLHGDSLWFRRCDRIAAEFSLATGDSSKMTSFIGTREVVYTDLRVGEPIPDEVLGMDNEVAVADDRAGARDDAYWEQARPYRLSERERGIYAMVDSVQQAPLYRNIYTVVNTVLGGYYNTKYVGIGPYYKMLSFNRLEGLRMQLGGRTTTAVSRRVRLTGYAAYGTRDEEVKGGGSVELVFNRGLMRKLTVSGSHDVVQLGAGQHALTESNLLGSVFARGGRRRLSMVDRGDVGYEHEWRHGVTGTLGIRLQRIFGNEYVPFLTPDGRAVRAVDNAEVHAGLRFAHNEKVYRTAFDRRNLGSKYPVLTLGATTGVRSLVGSAWNYCRLEGSVHYAPKLPPVGYSEITLQGGRIFGTVPYPLLKLHEGNATYFYDAYAFSCMNFYEFASDAWVALFYEHHFNGWLLGRIPLLERLKWREVLVCKGVWGTLSPRNDGSRPGTAAPLLFPEGMSSVDDPYVEVGFGVENIFRLLRVDCIWRVTHRESVPGQEVQHFAVNMSLRFKF
ncbi:MAG: DUF5686 and carboxypeptidase regulatory-like domain-containing protein [Alistipes sp.]|nr:DUF5686 and carboxypeptidase regulatory-like domain-containing protein [Alistipes sp.]